MSQFTPPSCNILVTPTNNWQVIYHFLFSCMITCVEHSTIVTPNTLRSHYRMKIEEIVCLISELIFFLEVPIAWTSIRLKHSWRMFPITFREEAATAPASRITHFYLVTINALPFKVWVGSPAAQIWYAVHVFVFETACCWRLDC